MADYIGGIHPVLEALKARANTFVRIHAARDRKTKAFQEVLDLARASGVRVEFVERNRLDQMLGEPHHQGLVAEVGPYPYAELDDILSAAGPESLVILLDGVQDPRNLGSLIRSAVAAGADGVVLTRERSAPVTSAAIKASAGAAEHIKVARVVNLVRAMETLKEQGYWLVGLEMGAKQSLYREKYAPRTGLVIGGEGEGLGRLVGQTCDSLVSIPMLGEVQSLNSSVAGAVAMFEYVRQTKAG